LPSQVIRDCNRIVKLPGVVSLNVATAGSILLYDRIIKRNEWKEPQIGNNACAEIEDL
jgi:tRNA G18 (ribose-2'-O)-methylase SpoU